MKSKATLYILIALLLIVWGIILWRIFLSSESPPTNQGVKEPLAGGFKDTVQLSLSLNYRDPFGIVESNSNDVDHIKRDNPTEIDSHFIVNVRYIGRIKSEGRIYYLLDIEGEGYCLMVGQMTHGVKVLFAHNDSIKVVKDGHEYLLKQTE